MKKLAIILGIILGTVTIACGAVAAYDYTILRDLVGLGLSRDPNTAVNEVYENMEELAGYHVDNESFVKATIPTGAVGTESLSLSMIATGDYVKPNKTQFTVNFETKDLIEKVTPLITSYVPEGEGVGEILTSETKEQLAEIKIDGIYMDKKFYLKVPLILKDDWIEFPEVDAPELTEELTDQIKNLNFTQYATEAEKLNDEVIDGVKCYHFQFKLDFDKLLSSSLFKNIPQKDLEEVKKALEENRNPIDIYVGRRDLLVHKDKVNYKMTALFSVEVNVENTYSNFGQIADIKTPTKTKKMETITATDLAASPIGQIILKVYTPDAKTKDLKRKSDLKIIKDALKEYAKGHENRYPILTDTSKDSKFLEILVPKYLSKVPLDPINNSEYYYGYKCKDGRTYKLYCTLENNADSESKDGLYQLTN
jgi:hypothetical protein